MTQGGLSIAPNASLLVFIVKMETEEERGSWKTCIAAQKTSKLIIFLKMEVNKMTTIAIPSMTDSGLESDICAHFGSCEYFTIVKVEDGKVEEVGAISNV